MEKTVRIVLVEDDEAIRDVLVIVLQSSDYDVEVFASAEEFMDAEIEDVDLFLIDYRLPGMNGIQLCNQLKADARTAKAPVILLSADFYLRKKLSDCGAISVIDKPFSRLELLNHINAALHPK